LVLDALKEEIVVREHTSTTGHPLNVPHAWLDHDKNVKSIRKLRWIGRSEEAKILVQKEGQNADAALFLLHELAERLQAAGTYLSAARPIEGPGPPDRKSDAAERAAREFRSAQEAFHRLREYLLRSSQQPAGSLFSPSAHWPDELAAPSMRLRRIP
jgi:hypothetical protein